MTGHGKKKARAVRTPRIDMVLASSSPRRRAMLAEAGWRFRVVVPDVVETPRRGEAPEAFARRAARDKAAAVAARLGAPTGRRLLVACDTIVVRGRRILGKPVDAADARRMLRALSGRTHAVISGVCLWMWDGGPRPRRLTFAVRTAVTFRRLGAGEIAAYVRTGEPMDKAGAYAIQGGAAGMARRLRGSYSNVVGLPMEALTERLRRAGWTPAGSRGHGRKTS